MKFKNTDFSKKFKLLINGEEYIASNELKGTEHIFNNSGSFITLKDVYPAKYTEEELIGKPFKIPAFSLAELYYGDTLFAFGITKMSRGGTLNPFKLKTLDVTIATPNEFLVHKPMDFAIFNKKPEWVVDKIIEKLGISYIVKGKISFTKEQVITAYNTKDMSAYDTLRFLEKQTNSILVIKLEENKKISINFMSQETIQHLENNFKGVDIDYSRQDKILEFASKYVINDISWEENNGKDFNTIRVESEKSLSTISKKIEVDLSILQEKIVSPFQIGKIEKNETVLGRIEKVYNATSGTYEEKFNIIRRLSVVTQEEADNGRIYDIAFTQFNNSLSINKRLFENYKDCKIVIYYYPVIRQSVDFEDLYSQNEFGKRLGVDNFKTFRYEKHNDVTDLKDMINYGQHYINLGKSNKVQIKVVSEKPIWDIGEHVYVNGGNRIDDITGNYIVREIGFSFKISGNNVRQTFNYTLSDLKQLESEQNFYDSQAYRDNPVIDIDKNNITFTKTISDNIQIKSADVVYNCENVSYTKDDTTVDIDGNYKIDELFFSFIGERFDPFVYDSVKGKYYFEAPKDIFYLNKDFLINSKVKFVLEKVDGVITEKETFINDIVLIRDVNKRDKVNVYFEEKININRYGDIYKLYLYLKTKDTVMLFKEPTYVKLFNEEREILGVASNKEYYYMQTLRIQGNSGDNKLSSVYENAKITIDGNVYIQDIIFNRDISFHFVHIKDGILENILGKKITIEVPIYEEIDLEVNKNIKFDCDNDSENKIIKLKNKIKNAFYSANLPGNKKGIIIKTNESFSDNFYNLCLSDNYKIRMHYYNGVLYVLSEEDKNKVLYNIVEY